MTASEVEFEAVPSAEAVLSGLVPNVPEPVDTGIRRAAAKGVLATLRFMIAFSAGRLLEPLAPVMRWWNSQTPDVAAPVAAPTAE